MLVKIVLLVGLVVLAWSAAASERNYEAAIQQTRENGRWTLPQSQYAGVTWSQCVCSSGVR